MYLGHDDVAVQTSVESLRVSLHAHLKGTKRHVLHHRRLCDASTKNEPAAAQRLHSNCITAIGRLLFNLRAAAGFSRYHEEKKHVRIAGSHVTLKSTSSGLS